MRVVPSVDPHNSRLYFAQIARLSFGFTHVIKGVFIQEMETIICIHEVKFTICLKGIRTPKGNLVIGFKRRQLSSSGLHKKD